MNNIVNIVIVFLKHWVRRKSTIFWTILFPILLITIFGSIFSTVGDTQLTLYIQNNDVENGDVTALSQGFIDSLNVTGAFIIDNVDIDDDLDEILKGSSSPRALIIPKGFSQGIQNALMNNDDPAVEIILRRDLAQITDPSMGIINTVIRQFSTQLLVGDTKMIVTLQEEGGESGFRYIDFFIPGVIGMTVMTTGLMGAVQINTEYKMNGVLRKLATTPISKMDWVLSIVIYEMLISFLAAGIIIGVGYLPISVFNVQIAITPPAILLIVAGSLVFPGAGMILARFVKDPTTGDAAANAIAFPMMFLSGTFFPIETYPDFLKPIAQVLPLTYLNNGLRAAMIDNQLDIAYTNTIIVMILAVIFIVAGTLLTNWREK